MDAFSDPEIDCAFSILDDSVLRQYRNRCQQVNIDAKADRPFSGVRQGWATGTFRARSPGPPRSEAVVRQLRRSAFHRATIGLNRGQVAANVEDDPTSTGWNPKSNLVPGQRYVVHAGSVHSCLIRVNTRIRAYGARSSAAPSSKAIDSEAHRDIAEARVARRRPRPSVVISPSYLNPA